MMEAWLKVVLLWPVKGTTTNMSTQRCRVPTRIYELPELEEKPLPSIYSQEPVIRNKSRTGIKSEFDQ